MRLLRLPRDPALNRRSAATARQRRQGSRALLLLAVPMLFGCGSSSETTSGSTTSSSAASTSSSGGGGAGGAGGAGGGGGAACEATFEGDTLHLAVGKSVAPGEEATMCLRWTTPEAIDVSGFVGTLGTSAHHALLLSHGTPTAPDGVAPCSEAELMDAQTNGGFQMLAGVSYESSGQRYDFPSSPVQVGLHVPAGAQLVFDAHFINPTQNGVDACATLDLDRGAQVIAKLQFRTILPVEQYGLTVPAQGSIDVTYEEPTGGKYRVAAASSHMHKGGTAFRMSVKETGQTLYETQEWAEPAPAIFDTQKIVVEDNQTFQLDCSFANPGTSDQHFPDQMCVGGMYLLPCTLPGAC